MGKTMLKAIAAIGAGGLTTGALWLLAHWGIDLTSTEGLSFAAVVTSVCAWVAAKAVSLSGPVAPPAP
jgi:hypothetical protein